MPTKSDSKELPYSARQMFELVADVERYPEFLPWNSAARIRSRKEGPDGSEIVDADLVISFKVFRERFTSRVTLWDQRLRIDTEYLDGPFKYLQSNWQFVDLGDEENPRSRVEFFVDFEFRNPILSRVIGAFFNEAMGVIVRAFEKRAHAIYGDGKKS